MANGPRLTVGVYQQPIKRSHHVCEAIIRGLHKHNERIKHHQSERPTNEIHDVAVFYGLSHGNKETMERYRQAGRPTLYIDLGYWDRHLGGRLEGYHKIILNGIHPGDEQMHLDVNATRYKYRKINEVPRGDSILVAGMQSKAAAIWGLQSEEYERRVVKKLRTLTDRPIIYRPKPNWKEATPIPGTIFSSSREPLDLVLQKTKVIVTHHSNVAIDGVFFQVPNISVIGAGTYLTPSTIEQVETLTIPSIGECYKWLHKLSYCQWRTTEMRQGVAWDFYKTRFLV